MQIIMYILIYYVKLLIGEITNADLSEEVGFGHEVRNQFMHISCYWFKGVTFNSTDKYSSLLGF